MINLKDLIVDPKSLGSPLMLVEPPRPKFEYVKNQRTDHQEGWVYTLLAPGLSYEKISVVVLISATESQPIVTNEAWDGNAKPVLLTKPELNLSQNFSTKAINVHVIAESIRFSDMKG